MIPPLWASTTHMALQTLGQSTYTQLLQILDQAVQMVHHHLVTVVMVIKVLVLLILVLTVVPPILGHMVFHIAHCYLIQVRMDKDQIMASLVLEVTDQTPEHELVLHRAMLIPKEPI